MRPAPILDMPTALSRRSALFGAVRITGGFACSLASAHAAAAPAEPHSDVRLSALAETMREATDAGARAEAFNGSRYHDDPDWRGAVGRFYAAAVEMRDTASASSRGVSAKARALRLPWLIADAETAAGIGASMAADVLRLNGGAA